MTTTRINKDGLQVASELQAFIDNELIPAIGVNADTFWSGFSKLVNDLAPKNAALLAKRPTDLITVNIMEKPGHALFVDDPRGFNDAARSFSVAAFARKVQP